MDSRGAAGVGLADLHMHTTVSDGRDEPAALIEHCCRLGWLDVVAVTDHDSIEGALRAAEHAARIGNAPDVIIGEEVTSSQGHILGLFLRTAVQAGMSAEATVAAIHDQGGLAIAAHPYWHARARCPHGTGDLIRSLSFDGLEVLNAGFTPGMYRANRRAQVANTNLGRAAIGASDAHVKQAIGWGHTQFRGHTSADLRAAIEAGSTAAARMPYGLVGIGRYLAWGIDRRPRLTRTEIA